MQADAVTEVDDVPEPAAVPGGRGAAGGRGGGFGIGQVDGTQEGGNAPTTMHTGTALGMLQSCCI